jgi:hypothetical protein
MRVYFTTTVPRADAILAAGFTDDSEEFGRRGVYCSTRPLDAADGFEGQVTLCLDVPEETFAAHDVSDDVTRGSGYRIALVPAEPLNSLPRPLVYDHDYAGMSRRDLVREAEQWEAAGPECDDPVQEFREAIRFFDRIGWLTPVKLQEQGRAER